MLSMRLALLSSDSNLSTTLPMPFGLYAALSRCSLSNDLNRSMRFAQLSILSMQFGLSAAFLGCSARALLAFESGPMCNSILTFFYRLAMPNFGKVQDARSRLYRR